MTETDERRRVVDCAQSWLGTPFHINAAIKGVGVDCMRLIWQSFLEAGVIADPGADPWPQHDVQWSVNCHDDVLVGYVSRYASEIDRAVPLPADILLIRRPEDFVCSHAGLVTNWPRVIHVFERVAESNSLAILRRWPGTIFRFFSVW